jgi:hypothetical protein
MSGFTHGLTLCPSLLVSLLNAEQEVSLQSQASSRDQRARWYTRLMERAIPILAAVDFAVAKAFYVDKLG